MTADPAKPGHVGNPSSWNYYTYVYGDPVNQFDPEGLDVERININYGPQPTCLGERFMKTISSAPNSWLSSDVGTLALQVWFEYEGHDGGEWERLVWRSIANVFRNRWNAPESMKVALGLKRKVTDKLDFKHLILKSSASSDSHWEERAGRVWLKSIERGKLVRTLNSDPDSGVCDAFIRSMQVSAEVYGNRSQDPTRGALSYISLWWPTSPPGYPPTPGNLSNPFGAFYTPFLTMTIDYRLWGTIRGTDYYLGFYFYAPTLKPVE
jgi:hypothetical protein